METRPLLHILFTMDCERIADRQQTRGPKSWELSARAIEGFCSRLLDAGYPPTLFVAPDCAEQQAPLFEELAGRGVELGLYLNPQTLSEGSYKSPLGAYPAEQQRAIIVAAAERFEEAIGLQPRSFRPALFSASDHTFKLLYELGFRQSSLSSPGQNLPREAAVWVDADVDVHYVDPTSRLRAGAMPFLELPLTTDPTQLFRHGRPAELRVESGPYDEWHGPIIDRQLKRMAAGQIVFQTLCLCTHNGIMYDGLGRLPAPKPEPARSKRSPLPPPEASQPTAILDTLIDAFDALGEQYTIVPLTLSGAHERFRRLWRG